LTRKRWWTLLLVQLGDVLIIIDGTIVNVALASIRADLRLPESSLVWIVNGYMIPFAGLMLVGGRLCDIYGARRIYLVGLALFSFASLVCGLASSSMTLVSARFIQGSAGALVSAAVFSFTLQTFQHADERAKALGLFAIVSASGGGMALLIGGAITAAFGWHGIFLINVPLGILLYFAASFFLPKTPTPSFSTGMRVDLSGSLTVTCALMILTYAVLSPEYTGWLSLRTLGSFALALLLLGLFLGIEATSRAPLVPLQLFRQKNLSLGSLGLGLLCTAIAGWYFISALYLRLVLNFSPLAVSVTFLPANLIAALCAFWSSKLIVRLGLKPSLLGALALEAIGISLLAYATDGQNLFTTLIPSMLLLGLGGNVAFSSLLLLTTSNIPASQVGVSSGVVNTTFTMGQTIGLAALAGIAGARTHHLLAHGYNAPTALTGGYQLALYVSAILVVASGACGVSLRQGRGEALG